MVCNDNPDGDCKQSIKNLKKYLKKKSLICRHCDSIKTIRVKKPKQKTEVKKYECKSCGRTFTEDRSYYSGYEPWIHQRILSATSKQIDFDNLVISLVSEGRKDGVTPPTTRTAIKKIQIRDVRHFVPFENGFCHQVLSDEWRVDQSYVKLPYGRKAYVYNVFSVPECYWLSSVLSPDSPSNISTAVIESVMYGVSRAGYSPDILFTDGLKIDPEHHKKHLKDTELRSYSSKNPNDKIHGAVDVRTVLHHIIRGFNPDYITYLWALIEINRYSYNFLQKKRTLNDKTPAESVGLDFEINDWHDLFRAADYVKRIIPEPFVKNYSI